MHPGPIGIFDSGYGGLTVFREIAHALPEYDFIYLGDNARSPYGTRSFETIYQYTLEAVRHLFDMDCRLVILACNTASARALRSIQQKDLPLYGTRHRVLGVIRPTAERIGAFTRSGKVGLLATPGTVRSESYVIEIGHQFPDIRVYQEACPMWVPLIENNEHTGPGADYFVDKHIRRVLARDPDIDALLLGCTHYPLLMDKIRRVLPHPDIAVISQGPIVADSLVRYLHRHPEMDALCTRGGSRRFLTTDRPDAFDGMANLFWGEAVASEYVSW
ncbi:MAG: glutamate racemase [Saprospiraceae bacterium]|nr:glutamate racemase [Saprospiraceae bacterium]